MLFKTHFILTFLRSPYAVSSEPAQKRFNIVISLKLCRNVLLRSLIALVIISSFMIPPGFCQETEDSQIFISGFNAYQQKDFGAAIEKMNEVLTKYPDTPLRDMALFWLARSYYKAGNQQDAARFMSQFSKEYPDNPLKSTVEDDLLTLTTRFEKGEKLPTGTPPVKASDRQAAALKAKAEQARLAREQAEKERLAKEQIEQERVAKAKAEEERLARIKADQERLAAVRAEEERKAAQKAEQERIAKAKAEEERVAAAAAAAAAAAVAEQARVAALKVEQERQAAQQAEQQRLAAVKAEEARKAAQKAEEQRVAQAKAEEARKAAEQVEQQRLAALKAEEARKAAQLAEEQRIAQAKAEETRKAAELAEQERIARAKAEQERIAALASEEERKAAALAEQQRLAAVKAEQERRAAELAEEQRQAALKAEEERKAVALVEQQRLAALKAEEARKAAELAEQQRLAAIRAEDERQAAAEAEQQRQAALKVEQERLAAAKAEETRLNAAAAEAERVAAQKKEQERLALAKAEEERQARIKADEQHRAAVKAEEERAAEAARIVADRKERERLAAEKAAADAENARMAAAKAEQERLTAAKAEEQRLAQQRAAEEKARAEKLALREKAIAQYKSIIERYPGTKASETAAAKLKELGIAVAVPPQVAAVEQPENAQILRIEAAQFAAFEFVMLAQPQAYNVARRFSVPFEVINRGNGSDSFALESGFPAVFGASFAAAAAPEQAITQTPVLAPGESFKGVVSLVIPVSSIDGLRITHPIRAVSRLMSEASQSREVAVVASAPLLRAVVKADKSQPLPGEKVVYRVALLNVGSTAAQDVTFRLAFPPQLEPADHAAAGFRQEAKSALVLDGLQINSGESKEYALTFQLKDDTMAGQELLTRAELVNNQLKTTAAFVSNVSVVQQQRGILVRSGSERVVIIPGQTFTVPFVVTNTGNVREKFKIASTVTGVQSAVVFHDINRDGIRQASEPVITEVGPLAPKEEASIVMEITTPRTAADASEGSVQVSFASEGDASRKGSGFTRLVYSRPVLQLAMSARDGKLKPGEVASFDLTVTNNGTNLARVVELQSAWPQELDLVAAEPASSQNANGTIVWKFKELGAGEKRTIKVSFRIKPGTVVGTAIQVKNVMKYEDQLGNRY